jgi:hypothetical protein
VIKTFTLLRLVLLFLSATFAGCSWFDRDIQIPSYIRIESIDFNALSGEGTSSNNIVDAWVFVDGQKIGAFQLPATIPVLASGNSEVIIFSGIELNGTAATRAVYTFYNQYSASVHLIPDSVVVIEPQTSYVENLTFEFIEDFESVGIVFEKTARSDTTINKTDDSSHVFEGSYCGEIFIDTERDFFEVQSIDSYELPQGGGFTFVEINCKSTIPFTVGVFANEYTFSTQHPVVVITASETWKKIYVNLTPTISRLQSAIDFNIFITAYLEEGAAEGQIWIDNVKLIHY